MTSATKREIIVVSGLPDRARRWPLVLLWLVMFSACPGSPAPAAPAVTLPAAVDLPDVPLVEGWSNFETLVDRLSYELRGRRLSAEERATLRQRGRDRTFGELYRAYLDAWLDADFYRRLFAGYMRYPNVGSLFIGGLERHRIRERGKDTWLYYLPHTVTLKAGTPPCPEEARVRVRPWWRMGDQILVCRDSYRPDHMFDDVGYCAGQPEPILPVPPRAGCGCGSMMTSCMPPRAEFPTFVDDLHKAVVAEVTEVGADIAIRGRPYDDLLTTSTTWQTGIVRFLYLRRELVGDVHRNGWSKKLEARYARRLAKLDLFGPGQWVRRARPYEGTGVFFTTPATQAAQPTYRALMSQTLEGWACVSNASVRVDSHALLTALGGDHDAIRSFDVHESPMRSMIGCKGCHAPMDNAAGFMRSVRTALFGGYPTGLEAKGKLYVRGADDFRGEGEGFADLASLLTRQPEFPECAVWRLVARFVGRTAVVANPTLVSQIRDVFERSGRKIDPTVRALLESREYTAPVDLGLDSARRVCVASTAAAAPDLAAAASIIRASCVSCHDENHRINLSIPVGEITRAKWELIAAAVKQGSMPPPRTDQVESRSDLSKQFTLDLAQRRILVRTAARVAASELPTATPAANWALGRSHRVELLREFGRRLLPAYDTEAVLDRHDLARSDARDGPEISQIELTLAATELCASVIDGIGWTEVSNIDDLAIGLFVVTLGRPPVRDELERARARYAALRREIGSARRGASAYCVSQLTIGSVNSLTFSPAASTGGSTCE